VLPRSLLTLLTALALLPTLAGAALAGGGEKPNVVLIFADDLGYADLACYGAPRIRTPHLDRLAREGVRFTDFYTAQPVCSASRAALLTGCYSNRVGILGALGPTSKIGINPEEATLAELLRGRGYATAVFGKWHLGHLPEFLPTRHGFDEYYGLPYSNDMWPNHPTAGPNYPPLPLIEGEKTLETNPDQRRLTTAYAERAVSFIERKKDGPFFLYLPHSMPHVPLFVSEKHAGKSAQGLYGDVIEELDWSVGQVLDALERHGLTRKTLVIFTSDNGPWLSYGDHAGSAGKLREGKGTTFEGGVRVPGIFRWPGRVSAGRVSAEPAMTIDVLPTVARLAGARLDPEVRIDGRDLWPVLTDPAAKSPHPALYFYWGQALEAVRSGRWKLHLTHEYRTLGGKPGGTGGRPAPYVNQRIEQSLFDLAADPGETTPVDEAHPAEVRRLLELAEQARTDLGDSLLRRRGENIRPAGRVD
jgi:arylsulfatase A